MLGAALFCSIFTVVEDVLNLQVTAAAATKQKGKTAVRVTVLCGMKLEPNIYSVYYNIYKYSYPSAVIMAYKLPLGRWSASVTLK